MKTIPLLRAACLGWALALAGDVRGQPGQVIPFREAPPQISRADAEDFLARFRQARLGGDAALLFELQHLPARSETQRWPGRLWAADTPAGTVFRLALDAAAGPVALLAQTGPGGQVWRAGPGGEVAALDLRALLKPLAAPLNYTAFDLQMPFLHWPDYAYEGTVRLSGRPAHRFAFRAPPEVRALWPELAEVRVALDSGYYALLRAEYLDAGGRALRTLRVNSFKKVQDRWMVRSLDVLDHATRDRTRLLVTAAALREPLAPALFAPADLSAAPPPPAPGAFTEL